MLSFILENAGDIIVCTVLILIFCLIIGSQIRRGKRGESCCSGGGCKNCSLGGKCGTEK